MFPYCNSLVNGLSKQKQHEWVFYYPEISENKITEYRLSNVENSCSES